VAKEKNDSNTIQALGKQLLPLVDKLGPEYVKVIEGMDQVDLTSSEGESFCPYFQSLIRDVPTEAGRRAAAKLLTKDEARRIACDDSGSRKDKRPNIGPAVWQHQNSDALNEAHMPFDFDFLFFFFAMALFLDF
jgi:hypothetical protein